MAELYDWSKEGKKRPPFKVTSTIIKGEHTLNVKRIEIPGREDKLIVKGLHSAEEYKKLKASSENNSKRSHSLVGGISQAINNALNRISLSGTNKLISNILLKPDSDGRLFFTLEGLKYYISDDKKKCIDEEGFLWMIDLKTGRIYGGCEEAFDFNYAFVSPELEKEYYDRLEELEKQKFGSYNPYDYLFTRDGMPSFESSKVVDLAAYRKSLEGDQPRGR